MFGQLGRGIRGLRVLPVYGGQGFAEQLGALKKGVHVIVGTPGRVMDHMRRNTLKLDHLRFLVLDEADEMLNMGFAEDIEWILQQTPPERQTALFSATMPPGIRKISLKYLRDPEHITIRNATTTADTISHRCWVTQNYNKFEALLRILETEQHDGVLIFVRTKSATLEIADMLTESGMPACALNGDMKQTERERTVERFKEGRLDILVATDVAARGLDVDRISHVINYDPPHDVEGYVHRVGRTGRAGRSGQAIMIATPRERRFLADIERATGQRMKPFEMPGVDTVNRARIEKFKTRLAHLMEQDGIQPFKVLIDEFQQETGISGSDIAAALARAVHGNTPLLLRRMPERIVSERNDFKSGSGRREAVRPRSENDIPRRKRPGSFDDEPGRRRAVLERDPEPGMDRYRLECGYRHNVQPGNIVGAIANEAGLRGSDIGHINIFDDYSTVDLPSGMPDGVFNLLKKTKIANRYMDLSILIQSRIEQREGGAGRGRVTRSKDRQARRNPKKRPRRGS